MQTSIGETGIHRFVVSILYPDPALKDTEPADANATSTYWQKDFSFLLEQSNASSARNGSSSSFGAAASDNSSLAGAEAGGIDVEVEGQVVGYQVCVRLRVREIAGACARVSVAT